MYADPDVAKKAVESGYVTIGEEKVDVHPPGRSLTYQIETSFIMYTVKDISNILTASHLP